MNAISNNSKPIEPKGMGKREREREKRERVIVRLSHATN